MYLCSGSASPNCLSSFCNIFIVEASDRTLRSRSSFTSMHAAEFTFSAGSAPLASRLLPLGQSSGLMHLKPHRGRSPSVHPATRSKESLHCRTSASSGSLQALHPCCTPWVDELLASCGCRSPSRSGSSQSDGARDWPRPRCPPFAAPTRSTSDIAPPCPRRRCLGAFRRAPSDSL